MRRAAAARPALEALAAVCIGVAAAAAYAGPLRFEMGEIDLSVRSLGRPLLAAAALLAVRFAVPDRARDRLHDGAGAAVRVCVGAVIAAALAGWMAYQSPTVGGADSYGYVSAAERIARGTLIEDEPLARILPFDDATRAAVPLGYVPSAARPHASAPAYPLGLPALMAAAIVAGGRDAAFMVAPVLGLALVAAALHPARSRRPDPRAFRSLRMQRSGGVDDQAGARPRIRVSRDRAVALAASRRSPGGGSRRCTRGHCRLHRGRRARAPVRRSVRERIRSGRRTHTGR
jgi:hypothetical protein